MLLIFWNFLHEYWYELLSALYYITALWVIFFMVGKKLDPVKTISWSIVLIALPFVGLVFYIFLGQNYRKEKIFSLKEIHDLLVIDQLSKQQIAMFHKPGQYPSSVERCKNIITLLLNNSKSIFTEHNHVEIYSSGETTLSAMKDAIGRASDSIHLESYIIEDDEIGNEIKDLLIRKAREGVEVRVIYDDVGSWNLSKKYVQSLRQAGVEIVPFAKVHILHRSGTKVNYRNHRKILVVDGYIGFMGGINVADRYVTGGKFGAWRDTHMRIEGEAVPLLQAIFLLDWYFVTKKQMGQRKRYYPDARGHAACPMQIASSGPDSDWASVMQAYFAAIVQAKDHIYITTPYFTPNESILTAIKTASLGGVDVRLVIPARSDSKVVYFSTRSYFSELLEAGVKIYLFQKGFNHSKVMMVDGYFAAVGSANMDIRSFEHNFEIISLIYDEEITRKLELQFHEDMSYSRLVRLRWWNKRSRWSKSKESLARLCSPLL
ncbi:MAG: cardiolipin synthase [Prevotellaceae bacterium]|jgi:cardiolipin synthase|nr:cardiolipin synthase [Prevotellaceae bacterium]